MKDQIKSVIERTSSIPSLVDVGIAHPIWEFVGPVVSENEVLGSCFFVGPGNALTAGHVFNELVSHLPPLKPGDMSYVSLDHSTYAVRIRGNETDTQRMVAGISAPATDIALLTLKSCVGPTGPEPCLELTLTPPPVGSRIVAYGRPDGIEGTELKAKCSQVICNVVKIFGQGRDQRLPFACFSVDHEFSAGMSGGPVFNEEGQVCGVVCSGGIEAHVALLWPAFSTKIQHDFDGVIQDESRSIIEFFDKLNVPVVGLEKFSLTEDGRPQYHHGFGTVANPYEVKSKVPGPAGVNSIYLHNVHDTGMLFSYDSAADSPKDFTELGEKCVHYLLTISANKMSWVNDKNSITVKWQPGTPLLGRLFIYLTEIENRRLADAKNQQEIVIERWEMDKLLGRFQ
jgi:hypothetical protein